MPVATIRASSCIGCGRCATVCPVEAILQMSPKTPYFVLKEKCIGCGSCINQCPQNCILLKEGGLIDFAPLPHLPDALPQLRAEIAALLSQEKSK